MEPKDQTDRWIERIVPGQSFIDIGGIGVDCVNERVTFAASAGASQCAMSDIRPLGIPEWDMFHQKCKIAGLTNVAEFPEVDTRDRASLARVGKFDVVHCTGVLYHVQSPAEVLWNLRSITSRYLITNTVTFPGRVENEHGIVEVPDHSVLFTPALGEGDRKVLNKYYLDKFGWGINYISPPLVSKGKRQIWIENDELTCWPVWYLYTDHAFKMLLKVCRLKVIDEWKWAEHSLQVLCEVSAEPIG